MKRPLWRHRRLLFLLLTLFIAACSFKTLYNSLDVLIPEYVEGLVTLDGMLEDDLKKRSQVLLEWHRSTQLVRYVDWLRAFQGEAGVLTVESAQQSVDQVDAFWDAVEHRINNEMSLLLPRLSASQQAELFENIAEKNEEFREDYIDPDEEDRREDYFDRTRETYESWLGALTEEQQQQIRQATDRLLNTAPLRLQRREAWQGGIRTILAGEGSAKEKSVRLRAYLADFIFDKEAQLDREVGVNKTIIIELTVAMSTSMTKRQHEHFIEKTNDYIQMLTELSENR